MAYDAMRAINFEEILDNFVDMYVKQNGYAQTTGFLEGLVLQMFHDLKKKDQENMVEHLENKILDATHSMENEIEEFHKAMDEVFGDQQSLTNW